MTNIADLFTCSVHGTDFQFLTCGLCQRANNARRFRDIVAQYRALGLTKEEVEALLLPLTAEEIVN